MSASTADFARHALYLEASPSAADPAEANHSAVISVLRASGEFATRQSEAQQAGGLALGVVASASA
jgi:hypothetical protein